MQVFESRSSLVGQQRNKALKKPWKGKRWLVQGTSEALFNYSFIYVCMVLV